MGCEKSKYLVNIFGQSISENKLSVRVLQTPYFKVDDLNVNSKVVSKSKYYTNEKGIKAPLILIPKRGAAIATNKVKISYQDSLFDSNIMGIRVNNLCDINYYSYFLQLRGLWDLADISTVPQINNKHIFQLKLPLPDLSEQEKIVKYLDLLSNKVDSIITKTKQQISKLKEAKQSLISEAVTGKIDLRDWEIIETGGR